MKNKAIEWGCEYLSSHGYTLKSNLPDVIQERPWSYVVRFATSDGYIYLKNTPKLIALEATITRILYDQFHAPVPVVIAHNDELDCFLMQDAGTPLRQILKKDFDITLLCKAIDLYASTQLAVVNHLNIFLDIGVPDWRLDKLPDLYIQLISHKDILIADGLSEVEIAKLESLSPTVNSLCKELSSYSIFQTIIQPDFHDNNLLISDITQKVTLMDLGEIVVSHPFLSLINFLWQIKKHHALIDSDNEYIQIMDACLMNYTHLGSKEHLLRAFATAEKLFFVYSALANYRLMVACGVEKLMSFQAGRLGNELKAFMRTVHVKD